MTTFLTDDEYLLMQRCVERTKKNEGKQVDNASLPSGSPMHYYCNECKAEVAVLPECHNSVPQKFCDPCQHLSDRGLLSK